MCGLAGIFAYGEQAPPVDREELLVVRDYMTSRGPDGAGLWTSSDLRIGLAHRRLAIIDLTEAGAQPMASANGRYRIVFNGEIYNYRELRSHLVRQGAEFRSQSDTEVLLQLFEREGMSMCRRLRGMYAFSIWDAQERSLHLARDPFGIKPLYFADDGNTFRFASQVRALTAGKGFPATPDPAGWAGFFVWGAVQEPFTTFREIRALPAGSVMTVAFSRRPKASSYFSIEEEFARSEGNPVEGREARESDIGGVLEDSVRAHLVSDVPVGVFLSAGIDSSAIARVAARHVPSLRTMTMGFEEFRETADDETKDAEALALSIGARHTTRWIGRKEFQAVQGEFLSAMDQPTIDGLNTYLVSKVAAEAHLKVALSGLGGDELFAGYPSFRQVPALTRAAGWAAHFPAATSGFRSLTSRMFAKAGVPKYAGLLEYGHSYAGAYLLRRAVHMPWELPGLMSPEVAREGLEQLGEAAVGGLDISQVRSDFARVATLESSIYMRNMLLRDTDWASMAHSVEVRIPLLDVEVFRHVCALVSRGVSPSKRSLMGAATGGAGAAGGHLIKRGFTVPMHAWKTGAVRHRRGGIGTRMWSREVAQACGWERTLL